MFLLLSIIWNFTQITWINNTCNYFLESLWVRRSMFDQENVPNFHFSLHYLTMLQMATGGGTVSRGGAGAGGAELAAAAAAV